MVFRFSWSARDGTDPHNGAYCILPLDVICKSMGHASLQVAAIYANPRVEDRRSIGARLWK